MPQKVGMVACFAGGVMWFFRHGGSDDSLLKIFTGELILFFIAPTQKKPSQVIWRI